MSEITSPTSSAGRAGRADSIDRRISIAATAEKVFHLVSRPGWWINDGTISDNRIETEGDVSTVTHEKYGSFRIRTVEKRRPNYVSFRWLGGDRQNEGLEDVPGTLVEFWVDEAAGGGVTLRVLESGFAGLPISEEQRLKNIADNTKGWEEELAAARAHAESA